MDEPLALHPYAKETPLTESARAGVEVMSAELAEGHTEALSTLLAVMSRHPRRSLMNQILIAQQAPAATDLATFDEWAAQGYAVAKGQTGIRLLQQRSWTHTNPETGEEEFAQGIVSVPFFDVSQLNAEQRSERPVASPLAHVASLLGNPAALSAQLEHALAEAGISVIESAEDEQAGEQTTHTARKANTLVVRPGVSAPQHWVDLLYAYAQQLVRYDQQRASQSAAVRQIEAAVVTFVIGARYGVGVKLPAETLRALDTSPEGLLGQLDTMRSAISRLARRIEIEDVAGTEAQAAVPATAEEDGSTSEQASPTKTRTRQTTQHREAVAREDGQGGELEA